MVKAYRTQYIIDSKPAESAIARVNKLLEQSERVAIRAVAAMSRAYAGGGAAGGPASGGAAAQAGNAAVASKRSTLGQIEALQDQYLKRDYARTTAYQAKKQKAEEAETQRSAKAKEKEADQLQRIEDGYRKRDYDQRVAHERRKQKEAERTAKAEERLRTKALTDEQVALSVRNRLTEQSNNSRLAAAMHAHQVESGHLDRRIEQEGMAAHAVDMTTVATLALAATAGTLRFYIDSWEQIKQKAEEAARASLDYRDSLRVEATLKGLPQANNQALQESLKFRVATGLGEREAGDFTKQFLGSLPIGLQKGNITQPVADKLHVQAGIMAARQGGDAGTRGDLAGILGQFGKIDSVETGLGQLEAIRIGLTEGRGDDTPLTQQLLKSAGSIVREGGDVPDLPGMAALIGVTSLSAGTQGAATAAEQLVRGLGAGLTRHKKVTGAKESQADYLKRIGIKENMSLEQKLDLLVPDLRKAIAEGRDPDVYLSEHGVRGEEERDAFKQATQNYDAFKIRMAKSRTAQDGGKVARQNKDFLRSAQGQRMVGRQMQAAAEVTRGLRNEHQEARMTAMEASPEIQKGDDSQLTQAADLARGMAANPLSPGDAQARGRKIRIEQAVEADLERRAIEAGVSGETMRDKRRSFMGRPTFRADYTNWLEEQIRGHFGDAGLQTAPVMERLDDAAGKHPDDAALHGAARPKLLVPKGAIDMEDLGAPGAPPIGPQAMRVGRVPGTGGPAGFGGWRGALAAEVVGMTPGPGGGGAVEVTGKSVDKTAELTGKLVELMQRLVKTNEEMLKLAGKNVGIAKAPSLLPRR